MWVVVDIVVIAAVLTACVFFFANPRWQRRANPKDRRNVNGTDCWVQATRQSRGRTVQTSVSLECAGSFEFKLRREGWYDRLAKAVGMSVEFQTQDEEFDEATYVVSDDPAVRDWLTDDTESRQALLNLLRISSVPDTRVTSIESTGRRIVVSATTRMPMFGGDNTARIGEGVASACVSQARLVCDRLSSRSSQVFSGGEPRDRYARRAGMLKGLSIGIVILGAAALIVPDLEMEGYSPDSPLRHALLVVSGWVIAALTLWTLKSLWGSSRAHTLTALVVVCSAFGVPALANRIIVDLNQQLDTTSAHIYSATVYRHERVKSRNSTSYYLSARQNDSDRDVRLKVDGGIFDRVRDSDEVLVEEKPGYLGIPWVRNLTLGSAAGP
jgi:hypothetical protein